MKPFYIIIAFLCFSAMTCKERSNGTKPYVMKLWTIENANKQTTLSKKATKEEINTLMESIDWSIFHQVILEQKNGDALEVGGSLEDGFSASLNVAYEQFIIYEEPKNKEILKDLLLIYLEDAERVMDKYKFY